MRDKPGGRAYVYKDKGFTFDAGPTIITVPFVLDELAALAGKSIADYVTIVPCDPFYRIYFDDGREFNYVGDQARLEAEIARFNPDDVAGYRAYLAYTEKVFDRAFTDLADHSFHSIWEMVKVAPDLIKLRADQSVYKKVSTLHPGSLPAPGLLVRAPLDRRQPAPVVVDLLDDPLPRKDLGRPLRHGRHRRPRQRPGQAVRGHGRDSQARCPGRGDRGRTRQGPRGPAVDRASGSPPMSSSPTATWPIPIASSSSPSTGGSGPTVDWRRMKYAMSLFVAYFGTDRTYPHLPHHSIVLGPRYHGLLGDIFDKKVVADDFSLYLHAPTRTDPSLAPPGCETFYVLSPVPHLDGGQDWDAIKDEYADRIFASLEKDHLVPDLRKHLVTLRLFTPKDFEIDLDAFKGSAFQFEPVLTQSAWFRPHNRSEDVGNLFFVGAGTHPGAGLPGVISSAKVLEKWL